MKQLVFMVGILGAALWAAFFAPFWGLLPYYLFSILQPQYLWKWALPEGIRWSMLAAGIAVIGTLIGLKKVMQTAQWSPTLSLLCLYGFLITLSYIQAYDFNAANYWYDITIKTLFMALLVGLLTDSIQRVRILILLATATISYLGWHFNILYLTEHRMDLLFYGLGTLDNNGIAMILAMGIPLVYAVGISVRPLWMKLACAGLGVFLVHGIMLAYSRGAMLSAGLIGVWILWRHRPRLQAFILTPTILLVVMTLAGPAVRARFMSITNDQFDASIQARYNSWSGAMDMIIDHPITGMGLRNSNIFSQNYGADMQGRTIHNLYLQLAADNGLPTLGVYLAIAGLALYNAHRCRRELLDWNEDHPILPPSHHPSTSRPANLPSPTRLEDAHHFNQWMINLFFGVQASLALFLLDSFFFSSEILEVAWLLMITAGISPALVHKHLDALDQEFSPQTPAPAPAAGPAFPRLAVAQA